MLLYSPQAAIGLGWGPVQVYGLPFLLTQHSVPLPVMEREHIKMRDTNTVITYRHNIANNQQLTGKSKQ